MGAPSGARGSTDREEHEEHGHRGSGVGGGAVAVAGAQRDIVVAAGTHITFQLPKDITVK